MWKSLFIIFLHKTETCESFVKKAVLWDENEAGKLMANCYRDVEFRGVNNSEFDENK
jgi:hypothetical protein